MTITSDPGPWSYTANGVTDEFAYENKIFADTDLVVTVADVAQVLDTDYTVTGVGDADGGLVVFGTPPASGTVRIRPVIPAERTADFVDNSRFPAANVNRDLDRAMRLYQQADAAVSRSLRVGPADDPVDAFDDAALRRGKTVMFEDSADAPPTLGTPTTTVVSAASESAAGIVELATTAETNAGADDARAVTPAKLAGRTATETRAGVVELATTAEAVTGTDTARAVTPAGLAAGIAASVASLGWRPLARFVPTAAATLAISGASYFATTYSRLRVTFAGIRPATDNDDLRLRISVASSIKSGASDYAWQRKVMSISSSVDGSLRDSADTQVEIADDIGNAASESLSGVFEISQAASATIVKQMSWCVEYLNGSTLLHRSNGEAVYVGGTEALDQLVFYWSSAGNFAAVGEAFLEGLKTS
jgi:hypothetical protein